jgi:hypothetical protein
MRNSAVRGLDRDSGQLNMAGAGLPSIYDEEAFRYFLEIERRRADRSGCPFLLMLINIRHGTQNTGAMDDRTAAQIFCAVSACLRNTDFVGWYRTGRTAGGVLTQDSERATDDSLDRISDRVRGALARTLSTSVLRRAQIRLYQVPRAGRGRA